MKRVLILGGNGMIGHSLYINLKKEFHVSVTFRSNKDRYRNINIFEENDCFYNLNANDYKKFFKLIEKISPDYIINCIGVTKQLTSTAEYSEILHTNALFPKFLSSFCIGTDSTFIQLSTDCIFSGNVGNYLESSIPDPVDFYGASKFLGECIDPNTIVLRKSTIGLELCNPHGLIEWFLKSSPEIEGYKNAIYSGLTTKEFSRAVATIINSDVIFHGLLNIASQPVSKFDLLTKLSKKLQPRFQKKININTDFKCNRALNSLKFNKLFNFQPLPWDQMLNDLSEEIIRRK